MKIRPNIGFKKVLLIFGPYGFLHFWLNGHFLHFSVLWFSIFLFGLQTQLGLKDCQLPNTKRRKTDKSEWPIGILFLMMLDTKQKKLNIKRFQEYSNHFFYVPALLQDCSLCWEHLEVVQTPHTGLVLILG